MSLQKRPISPQNGLVYPRMPYAAHIVDCQVVALSLGGILYLHKRALYLCKRALYLLKRALYILTWNLQPTLLKTKLLLSLSAVSYVSEKEPYICAKEPYIFSKDLGIPAHETCTMASVSH